MCLSGIENDNGSLETRERGPGGGGLLISGSIEEHLPHWVTVDAFWTTNGALQRHEAYYPYQRSRTDMQFPMSSAEKKWKGILY